MAQAPKSSMFSRGQDERAQADQYANGGPHYADAVDRYTPRPKLGAGGAHNRPASGHESQT